MNSLREALAPIKAKQDAEQKARILKELQEGHVAWREALLRANSRIQGLKEDFKKAGGLFFMGRIGFMPTKQGAMIEQYNQDMEKAEKARKNALAQTDKYFDLLQKVGGLS